MHSMYLRRCAVALVHVTATDPLRARRHSDLVTSAIVANHSANGMSAMPVVVARLRRIVTARVADAVVDRVMPVVIVIGVLSVPAAVMRLERIVRPALASVSSGYCNSLSPKAQCPHVRRVRVG